jgi:hypothetical protein
MKALIFLVIFFAMCVSAHADSKINVVYENELKFWKIIEQQDHDGLKIWMKNVQSILEAEGKNLFEKDHPYQRLAHLYSFGCTADKAPVGKELPLGALFCYSKFYKYGGNLWGSNSSKIMAYSLEVMMNVPTLMLFDREKALDNIQNMINIGEDDVEGYVVGAALLSIVKDGDNSNNMYKALDLLNNCTDKVCKHSPSVMAPTKKTGMNFMLAEMLFLENADNKDRSLGILKALRNKVKNRPKLTGQLNEINSLEKEIISGSARKRINISYLRYPLPRYLRKNSCVLCHAGASDAFAKAYSEDPEKIMELRYR